MIPVGILTAAATSSFSFLLDDYPGAAAAYSLRKLRSAYTGAAIRIENNTGAQKDVFFNSSDEINTTEITNFVSGGTDIFVVTWYDQSGNANNAVQVSGILRPLIYQNGLIIVNGKPSISSIGGTTRLTASTATGAGNGILYISSYVVFRLTNLNIANCLAHETGTDASIIGGGTLAGITGFGINLASGNVYSTNETLNVLKLGGVKTNTVPNVFVNGAIAATGTTGSVISFMNIFGGTISNILSHVGDISEMIFYNSDQSGNNTGINNNINTFYTIY
jgi:hypothetical protein